MENSEISAKVLASADRYRTLLEINNAIVTHLSREELLQSVSKILRRFLPLDGAVITLYNPETEKFRYFALETRLSTEYFRTGLEVHRKESLVTEIFERQRGAIRRDLERSRRFRTTDG